MPVMQHPDEDRNTVGFMVSAVHAARTAILGMVICTVVNLGVALFGGDMTLPIGISIPFYFTLIGRILDMGSIGPATWGALGASLAILGAFVIFWALSGKKKVWMKVAFWMTVADGVALVALWRIVFENFFLNPLELIFKVLLLVILYRGVENAARLQKMLDQMEAMRQGQK